MVIAFTSCDKPTITNVTINFTHTVDNISLVTGQGCELGGECLPDHSCCNGGDLLPYTNDAGENYNIQRLNYLISDITLHSDDGISILLKDVHFIDADDASTLIINVGEMDNGNYTSISYTMGFDTIKNISNLYVNESFHSTMAWPDMMGGGYHYMRLEGDYDTITQGYATHTGGTMGMDYSFNHNSIISLNIDDDLGDVCIDINMEINNWYQTPNQIDFSSYGMGIMMDTTMQENIQMNGITDVFSVTVDK